MKEDLKYIDLKISIDNNNLIISEKSLIRIQIKNISNYKLENGLFKLNLNTKNLSVDKRFYECIGNFFSIGDIEPGYKVNIDIPITADSIPSKGFSEVFFDVNFHILKNGNLEDINYKSEKLKLNIISLDPLKATNLKIYTTKNHYTLEEEIDIIFSIKNTTNVTLKDIKILNYIPNNTSLVENSLNLSDINNAVFDNNKIFISEINKGEEIYFFYKVSVNNINIKKLDLYCNIEYFYDNFKKFTLESNKTSIEISSEGLLKPNCFVYEIDKNKVFQDEIITHTIKIKNCTDFILKNLTLSNSFFDKLNFIKNSLIVNNVPRVGESINEEIILGELDVNDNIIIKFETMVKPNYSNITMDFNLNYDSKIRNIIQSSNSCELNVIIPKFGEEGLFKYQDKNICRLNEIITFTIKIHNKGNISAKETYLSDIISDKLEFIEGSIFRNDEFTQNIYQVKNIYLKDIGINEEIKIIYKVKAIGTFENELNYCNLSYIVGKNKKIFNEISNKNELSIFGCKIGNNNIKKELSLDSAKVGDIVTAILTIENTGNIECENLKIYEIPNNCLKFIDGSLEINNENLLNENIFDGVNILKLNVSEKIIIKYKFKITNIPIPNPIQDRTVLEYVYIEDDNIKNNKIYSNSQKLYINNPNINIVDMNSNDSIQGIEKYIHINDSCLYYLLIENNGNVGLENMLMNINLPEELILDTNSININNVLYDISSNSSIKLPNLNISQKLFVQFYVKNKFIKNKKLESEISLIYSYKDIKNKKVLNHSKNLKETINIVNPDLEINQFITDSEVYDTPEFIKNINIKNTGNIKLNNVFLNLNEFNDNMDYDYTVFINENNIGKKNILNLESIDIDETLNIVIKYNITNSYIKQISIKECEIKGEYEFGNNKNMNISKKSNKLNLNVKDDCLELKGHITIKKILVGEKFKYLLNIENKGNINYKNLKLNLNIPKNDVEYINNSLCINDKNMYQNNIHSEINLGSLNCNEKLVVSFELKVISIPFNELIEIESYLDYVYINKKDNEIVKSTNPYKNKFKVYDISLDIAKSISSEYLQRGDRLKIQTMLNNSGNVDLENIILYDNRIQNLCYVENSTNVDGKEEVSLNPIDGIHISKLKKGDNIIFTYEYDYLPYKHIDKIDYYSTIEYSYKIDDLDHKRKSKKSEVNHIECALSTFKEFNIDNEYVLKSYEPDIVEIVNVLIDCCIDEYYEVDSLFDVYKNCESNNFNMKKLVIKGKLVQKVEYICDDKDAKLYLLERVHFFTTFLNLPDDYNINRLILKGRCEDVLCRELDSRNLFLSTLICIEGLL